jgi:hypothetical protein
LVAISSEPSARADTKAKLKTRRREPIIEGMASELTTDELAELADDEGTGEPAGETATGRRAGPAGAVARLAGPLGRLGGPIGRLAGHSLRPILLGVGAGLAIMLLTVLFASALGGRTAAAPTPTPTPLWQQREGGWLALGAPVLQPPHLLPAERLRLLEGVERARTIEVQFRVLLSSGSSAPVWGVLLSYQSELEHTRLGFYADDYDGRRPYVALYSARNGKDGPVAKPQRVLDYDFWGRDSHRLTVQIGDQQVRATLDGQPLGRWPNPGIMAAPKGLYVQGGSNILFESFAAPLARSTP